MISSLCFALVLLLYILLHTNVLWLLFSFGLLLGIFDSCLYPSILGYGMDQLSQVSATATSFLVTVGAIGIPIGTTLSGFLGELLGMRTAMLLGPCFLVVLALIIFIVHQYNQDHSLMSVEQKE